MPDTFISTLGTYDPPPCTSINGGAGRCLSVCIGAVASTGDLLPQDICPEGEVCAPCTDPRTGTLTGACSLNGDAPTQEPLIFDKECCGTTGLCVPRSAVPEQFAEMLPADTCTSEGADWICAPKIKLEDLEAKFPTCQVLILGLPVSDPGACIPQCIADAQIESNLLAGLGLAQSDYQPGWMCAPCVNPLDGASTGACDSRSVQKSCRLGKLA